MVQFKVLDAYEHNGGKVVEVLARIEGAEGPTEVKRQFFFEQSEGYTYSDNGKRRAKTGTEYKAEIGATLDAEFFPKGLDPSP